jgi:DNA-binding response OmpR family regulator
MDQHARFRKTVLLVEADRNLARIMGYALRDHQFVVTEVTTGREALEVLDSQYPDAVVLDPALPDGAGAALMGRLRQMGQRGNVSLEWVVISDLDRAEAMRRYGRPIPCFLAKPFDPWDLVKLLEEQFS